MKFLSAVRDCTTANSNFEGKLINDFLFTIADVNKASGIRILGFSLTLDSSDGY